MSSRLAILLSSLLLVLPEVVAAAEPDQGTPKPTRPKPFFLRYYTPPELEIEAKIPQYKLPLKPEQIANWESASKHFKCNGTAELILKNGFAVEEGWGEELGFISSAYANLPEGVPMFVTVDTALHIQHILYDQLFGEIETTYMVKDLEAITAEALVWFDRAYRSQQRAAGISTKGAAAVRRNVAYFALAARLLDPKASVPEYAKREVTEELRKIEKGKIAQSPIFIYRMDYSMFKPRGHYTKSDRLGRYFQAMTWYAQGAFLFQGGRGMFVDGGTADIQTMQAIQIGRFFVENAEAYKKWQRMHAVLEFFAGTMDDVSLADVIRMKRALDAELAAGDPASERLGESAYLRRIREKLLDLPPPKIHATTGLPIRNQMTTPEQRKQRLEQARGMRLFGRRFSLDAYAMSKLTGFAYVGKGQPFTRAGGSLGPRRGYPSSLDVMTLLGSKRAEAILREAGDAEYAHYDRELARLKSEFANLSNEDWHSNVAICRLNLIRMLLEPVPEGYPTAMRTAAWQDRSLSTALAAWAQLKHDLVLAQKQPYAELWRLAESAAGYVEPLPLVYAEIRATNSATSRGLQELYPEAFGEEKKNILGDDILYLSHLEGFNGWLDQLLAITLKELRHEPLSFLDTLFLRSAGTSTSAFTRRVERRLKHPAVVADVFTEPNERRVLEAATGRFNLLWVVYQLPSGKKVLGSGPVMSYYEFKQPMDVRLTDEEWRDIVEEGKAPAPPEWMKTFLSRRPKK